MSEQPAAAPKAPEGVDTEKPSAARIYDWYLGGTQNWAVDREFGRRVEQQWPLVRPGAKQNREFMNRAVRAALKAGIRQFIDLGSGVPTAGNVHEVIEAELDDDDRATVLYVDYEPVAVAHATLILEEEAATDWAGILQADMRDPKAVLHSPTTREFIDFGKPVCLLMMAVLHFVGPDDDPEGLVKAYRDALAPGSWLSISQMSEGDGDGPALEGLRWFVEQYRKTSNPVWMRDRDDIVPFFGGWPLLEPGIVHLPDWRPERELNAVEAEARPFAWCGVAEKP
ncbi:SAM-dependent methyltransferase [Amycolatopsis sp. NPDC005232]|uniref:SAM-dependent methyltransferase n=1 Tax=unclassified Amycolatopsis TaxID=2618356 RepID=UPI001C69CC12|nr:SAM-dependent methyltransferase [Amycolatopsis sp. DSM 110486]QYN24809.1 SAM-dependent methyltransferase [Amycolatopsis sp. DSM 110486]